MAGDCELAMREYVPQLPCVTPWELRLGGTSWPLGPIIDGHLFLVH